MEVSRRLGLEWNSLTPEQKEVGFEGCFEGQPYKQEEAEDKKRYLKELNALGLTYLLLCVAAKNARRCGRRTLVCANDRVYEQSGTRTK